MRSLVGALGIALLLGSASAAAQQFTMKVAAATINDVQHEWQKQFKAGVDARSGGRIKVELYPASQLGPIPRMVEGTALGTIECFVTATGFLVSLDPRFQVFDAAGLFDDAQQAKRVFTDENVRKRLFAYGQHKSLEPVAIFVHSPYALLSRKPVRRVEDLKALKIRTFSTPMQIEPMKKLGASPVPMPLTEVMPALQNGTIDGLLAASTVYTAFKYYDAAKALTYLPSWDVVSVAVVNRKWLASLPSDLRQTVVEEARKAEGSAADWGMADVERSRKVWVENGGENIVLSAEERKRFLDGVAAATAPVLAGNATVKSEYEALLAAAKQHRQASK
jgi:TRAP-type C4-dicarboxylate transport system substrate-binding protein